MKHQPIRIIQLSDTHLFQDANNNLCGQNTDASFQAVLSSAQQNDWPPDFVLVTGDISQDRTPQSYARFKGIMSKLNIPVFCLPGNHDDFDVMTAALAQEPVQMGRCLEFGGWVILCLNSAIPGMDGGTLSPEELLFLENNLTAHSNKHVLITFHHSPISMKSQWLDSMVINNSAEFFERIKKFKNIRGLLWGHIHQEFDAEENGFKLMATPSTCIQFKPHQDDFSFDAVNPGYRTLALFPDGQIESKVVRIDNFDYTLDWSLKGY